MAQSRLAAQDQVHHRGADTAPSDLGSAGADDQELKLAMELSEAEAKHAAKGKRVMQRTPSEEDLQRALQESANLASSQPQRKQPPFASSAQQSYGEGSSAMRPDQDATDAELARALYESEQLAASSARLSGHAQTAEPPGPASAPMLPPSYTHQSPQATSSSASPPMPNRTAHNWPIHVQPPMDSTVRYPIIYQPGSSSSPSPSSSQQQQPQQQSSRQELHTSQQGTQQQSPPQGRHMPQHKQSQPPAQQQTAPRQQPAPSHRQLPHHSQHQHTFDQSAGSPSGVGPYLDGYHGSANLESILTGDEAFAKALQEEEYKASMSPAGRQPPPNALNSPRQLPGQEQGQDPSRCPGCGHHLTPPAVVFRGQSWHSDCFRCTACRRPIPPGQQVGIGAEDHMPYHVQCYSQKFDPRCMVCHDLIPKEVMARTCLYFLTWRSMYTLHIHMYVSFFICVMCTYVCGCYMYGKQA